MKIFPQNRWQAFGIHLLISLAIFVVLAATIYFFWYPGFLFRYDGGLQGMKLIAGVDVFMGPVLTLCVYKLGKISLRFDLTCITLLQIACLTGGMWAVWHTRPIAVVYAAGEFYTTSQLGYSNEKIDIKNVPLIINSSWPVWLVVDIPESDAKGIAQMWGLMGSGIAYNVENYLPYEKAISHLVGNGKTYAEISGELKLPSSGNIGDDVKFYPVTTSIYSGYLAVDTKTGKVVKVFIE